MNAQHRASVVARWGSAIVLLSLLGSAIPALAQTEPPPGIDDKPAWQLKQQHKPANQVAAAAPLQRAAVQPASPEMQTLNDDQLESRGAYRLSGNDPNLPFKDLEPLEDIIGEAKVVGVGHEWPSAGGSYIMQHRVFRFLVEKMGFRVMGIESPYFRALAIEQYVQGACSGFAPTALKKATFGNYASTELADQVEWMCQWNQTHPNDQLHVYGFDAQFNVTENMSALSAVMRQMGFSDSDPRMTGMNACDGMAETYFPTQQMPQASYDQCQGSLSGLLDYLIQNEKAIRKQISRQDYFLARAYARTQQAFQEEMFYYVLGDLRRAFGVREVGLADVAVLIRKALYPNQRVMLWIENESAALNGLNWVLPRPGSISAGDILKSSLGRNYVAIGMVSLHLNLNWGFDGLCGETNLRYGGPGPYVEDVLHAAGGGSSLLVDLKPRKHDGRIDVATDAGASDASVDHKPRERGGRSLLDPNTAYAWVEAEPVIMQDTFDALIYQENVPAAHYSFDTRCPGL
jgi:erythromycin esterase-like protein